MPKNDSQNTLERSRLVINKWVKLTGYALASAVVTGILYSIGKKGGNAMINKLASSLGYTPYQKYPIFMTTILKGESKGYNDYNWKSGGTFRSYFDGRSTTGNVDKKLTQYTIGEIINLQSKGFLFAVGKYQMIPVTLNEMVGRIRLSKTEMFNEVNQDKLGTALVDLKRPFISQYLNGKVQDTAANLTKAVYETAKEWSSVANPYTGISYYSKDRASTTADEARAALKEQRTQLA